jgi:hypothetical protein
MGIAGIGVLPVSKGFRHNSFYNRDFIVRRPCRCPAVDGGAVPDHQPPLPRGESQVFEELDTVPTLEVKP